MFVVELFKIENVHLKAAESWNPLILPLLLVSLGKVGYFEVLGCQQLMRVQSVREWIIVLVLENVESL